MTDNLSWISIGLLIKRLWLVALVFVILGVSVTTGPTTKPETVITISTMNNTLYGTNKTESIIPNVNITAVKDWIKHHKKEAAIGMIVGVIIALLVVILICCAISKFAVEKVKRTKKKKGGVLRGILKRIHFPKLKLSQFRLFKVQPKGGFGKEIKNIGTLNFSLYYEKSTAILYITIEKAEDLSLKSSAYVSFNFVTIELYPFTIANSSGDRMETTRVRNSVCPVFNDVITINILPEELKDQTLICSVYDENRTSPKDFIGAVVLELSEVFRHIYEKEKDFHEKLKWIKGGKGGDILLSFRWNPRKEIFYLIVKECSNLSGVDGKGQANPYVKVEVFDGTVRYFQDTTSTKSKTLFPVFNEMFKFELTDQQKKSIRLIISVKHRSSWGGKKQVIGQLSFSFRSIGSELEHWQTALSSGHDVEMMHCLHGAVETPKKHPLQLRGEEIVDELSDEENLLETEEDRLL